MTAINFTDEELDHLRGYYQIELAEAEKDVERIKDILSKLEKSKPAKPEVITEKIPGKRGRKPKINIDEILVKELKKRGRKPKASNEDTIVPEPKKRGRKPKVKEEIKKERKQRADKGSPRGKRVKPVTEEATVAEPIIPVVESKPEKPPIPKKAKKKKQPKRRGITLAPMSKPLPRRAPEPELPPADQAEETTEL
jgi:hypothetical protein